ncbi:MAG TPA: hypothetical protein VL053_05280 [Arachidicoccus sp.]|nr:hypothetical protein [Arachidicoccus sp.]
MSNLAYMLILVITTRLLQAKVSFGENSSYGNGADNRPKMLTSDNATFERASINLFKNGKTVHEASRVNRSDGILYVNKTGVGGVMMKFIKIAK